MRTNSEIAALAKEYICLYNNVSFYAKGQAIGPVYKELMNKSCHNFRYREMRLIMNEADSKYELENVTLNIKSSELKGLDGVRNVTDDEFVMGFPIIPGELGERYYYLMDKQISCLRHALKVVEG